MTPNFEKIDEKAAWDLHKEFKSDMRTLRDEEYKLAGIYMQLMSLAAGALLFGLARAKCSIGLFVFIFVVLGAFLLLLRNIKQRIKRGHEKYVELRGWVDEIRRFHAGEAYEGVLDYGSTRGKGAEDQIRTLNWTTGIVFVLVLGALLLNYLGLWQAASNVP